MATRGVSAQVLEQLRRNRNTVRFCLRLGVYSIIAFSVLYVLQDHVVQPFTEGIAWVTYMLMRAVNTPVTLDGVTVRVPNFGVSIQNNCNAVYEMGLFAAAAMAYPASARRRISGIMFAIVVLYLVNLIRVLSLVYTGYLMPGFFEAAHVYVRQVLFLVVLGALWLSWISWIRPVA